MREYSTLDNARSQSGMSVALRWPVLLVILGLLFTECIAKKFRKKLAAGRRSRVSASARSNVTDVNPDEPMPKLPPELTYVDRVANVCKMCPGCLSCGLKKPFNVPQFPKNFLIFASFEGDHNERNVRNYIKEKFPSDLTKLHLLPGYKFAMKGCKIQAPVTNTTVKICKCGTAKKKEEAAVDIHHLDTVFSDVSFRCGRNGKCIVTVNTKKNPALTYISQGDKAPLELKLTQGTESTINLGFQTIDTGSGKETFYAVDRMTLSDLAFRHSKLLQPLDQDLILAIEFLSDWIGDRLEYCYNYGIEASEQEGFQEYLDWIRNFDFRA